MKPKKLTKEKINNIVKTAVTDAVDFISSEIAPSRITAQKYFDGYTKLEAESGRNKVVATKCRDTIRAVKPGLMKVFLQSGKPVEFSPRHPDAVMGAEQATNYAQYVFNQNNGFRILHDVFHDALIKKVGVAKVYYDETENVEIDEYTGITDEQLALVLSDPDVEIIEQEIEVEAQIDEMGVSVSPAQYEVKVAKTSRAGQIKIESVAPEDFFVDRGATNIDDCYVCGHSSEGRVSDLVAMGFDFEEVYNLGGVGGDSVDDEEEIARSGHDDADEDENSLDPSMRKVLITEAYMKIDIEGTGVARMYKFLCAGTDYTVLDYELCDYNPFAVFEVDPEPHTFFGRSLVDIITEDQDAATSMLRGLLDAIALANNPRLEVIENLVVTMDDVMNNEIGAVIRTKGPNAVREISMGNAAVSAALPAMQYYDEVTRGKTGVSGAGMGLDADMLQSQTAQGVNAAVQAANAVSELIARTLAEGGMKQLVRIIAQLARQHPDVSTMMQIDGQFVPVNPASWATDMDLVVNVGLGNNKAEERFMMLNQTLQTQMGIWQSYGSTNGIVTLTHIRNTLADLLASAGIHNSSRYYAPMNPQTEQQLLMQAAQAAQAQGQQADPNAAFMQAEMGKAQIRAQTDMQKAAMDNQRKLMELAQSNDIERDKMAQDLILEAAKILGQYGTSVDVANIQAQQAAPRPFGGGM